MDGEVRYCTAEDGVRIAYSVAGEGPALLIPPFFVESFAQDARIPEVDSFFRRLSSGRTVVRYDQRGTGLSQRDAGGDMSLPALMRDLEAVVRASGLKRFSILAATVGGQRALTFAARHPRHVERLILYGTAAHGDDIMPRSAAGALAELARNNWTMAATAISDLAGRREYPEIPLQFAELYVEACEGDVAARLMDEQYDRSVLPLLATIKVPTLVLHRRHDPIFPFAAGQRLAAQIPGARFVPLEGHMHIPARLDAESVLSAIDAFLPSRTEAPATTPADRIVHTILFTDLVDHTTMMARLGDDLGRGVLREHEDVTRRLLSEHSGREVKTMGDGFMASFTSVTRALDCAIGLQRAFAERNDSASVPLRIRIGLEAGEPIEDSGDFFGRTVIMAARIAGQAGADEIVTSVAVRELCAGKGYLFADRGEVALRGFEDAVRLYDVRWRE